MRMRGVLFALGLLLLISCVASSPSGQGEAGGSALGLGKALLISDEDATSWAQAHTSVGMPNGGVIELSCDWLWLDGCGAVEILYDRDGEVQTFFSASVCELNGKLRLVAMSNASVWLCAQLDDDVWHRLAISVDLKEQRFTAAADETDSPCIDIPIGSEANLLQRPLYV
ncbi:MAG TPA: hypothetical protein ENF73_06095, partial [Proteobacteria bacterium]|nr:hypothetical protein [Pseudomonadota bacterium]